jgi:hypothetical protein
VTLLNQKTGHTWNYDAVNRRVRSETPAASYSNLAIRDTSNNSLLTLETNAETEERGTKLIVAGGKHRLVAIHKPSGMLDTVAANVHCVKLDTIYHYMQRNTMDEVVIPETELLGTYLRRSRGL